MTSDFTHCSGVSIVDFEQVNADWVYKSWYHLNELYLTITYAVQRFILMFLFTWSP